VRLNSTDVACGLLYSGDVSDTTHWVISFGHF